MRRNEENSMEFNSWNWCVWSKTNENDFFKSSQCSFREFSHLIYKPFEFVTHTSYTNASITHHSWRTSWGHNDIIIPGFQVIKRGISVLAWTSCPTRAPPHVPLESLVTWPPQTALDMCWPLSQGSEVLSGTVLREVNTYTKIPQRRAGAGHTAGALQQPKNGRGMTSSQGHEHRGTSDLVTSERPKSEGTCKF